MDTEKPISIESINAESLATATPAVLEDLLTYLRGINSTLTSKINLVYSTLEAAREKVALAATVAKMSPETKAALSQLLVGDHIKKATAE